MLGDGLLASYLLALDQVSDQVGRSQFDETEFFNFDVKPKDAIEHFRSKKVVRSKKFNDLRAEARAAAFTVGGIYRDDVLEGFKEEIARSLEEGTPQREVIKRFRSIVDGAGHRELGAWHLETVFRTNIQMAYGVGRRRALEGVTDYLPFWTYHAVGDDRTRPTHRALNGITLPADHEFWDEHYPPWDFACRCTVTPAAEIPEGYNPHNPSGQAEIVYDENGNPSKAEIGTAVHDLTVGKFTGVPPQGGLQEVIEGASDRARKGRNK